MDKGLWVLIVLPKIPKMPQNLYAQFVCPYPKISGFQLKKGFDGRLLITYSL